MDTVKIKAMVILSLLVIAIGVPAIYYASTERGMINNPPVAIITAPSKGYVGFPVQFSAANSVDDGFIMSYIWDFGDGSKSAGKIVQHTYTAPGNYTVTLIVYDNDGAYSYARKNISIVKMPTRVIKTSVNQLLGNVSEYIGREVNVYGIFAYGRNYSFFLVNSSGYRGIRVYVEPGAPKPQSMRYGDYLEIRARFTVYRNQLELKVENNGRDYVKILSHGGHNTYATISPDEWKGYNNSFVHIVGRVSAVYASYRYSIGNLTVYVSFNANSTGSPAVGDVFEVRGFLTYYHSYRLNVSYMEIYVRNSTSDFSRYVRSSYQDVSVGALIQNPEKYNNSAIHIPYAYVTSSFASWSFDIGNTTNASSTLHVYVQRGGVVNGMIFNGAKVEIWGNLVVYRGSWEIKIRNATTDRVVVLSKPTYRDISVEDLLADPIAYNGTNVHSWGVISWLYENSTSHFTLFGLFWNGSEVKVVGFNGSNMGNVREGYYADVYGQFTSYRGEWEIKIRPKSYDYVSTRPQTYREVNITQILKNPEDYNNTLVHVPYAKVKSVVANWLFWVSNSTSNSVDMSVYVERGGVVNGTPYINATVEIWGMVSQYNHTWEFKIRNNTNDTVIVKNTVSYKVVNIGSILENSSAYNGTLVEIPNATVVNVKYSYLFWVSNSTSNSQDIAVYAQKGVNVPYVGVGDTIKIYGKVTEHNGTYEILLRAGTQDRVVVLHSSARYVNLSYVHEVDSDGVLVHLGEQVIVNATVIAAPDIFSYVSSSSGKPILKMYVEDLTGGVLVFGYGLNYTKLNLTEGSKVQVRGTIAQYNGEAEIKITSLNYIRYMGKGQVPAPLNVSTGYFKNWTNAEKIEGMLVEVHGTVTSVNSASGYFYLDDGNGSIEIYAKAAGIDISNISVGENLTVIGVVAQYDKTSPYTSYYEILPRFSSDIVKESNTGKVGNMSLKSKFEEVFVWRIDTVLIAADTLDH